MWFRWAASLRGRGIVPGRSTRSLGITMSVGTYRYIVVEVISAPSENSRHKVRARPLPGQWAGPELRLECPTSMRGPENVGRLFKVWAKIKDTETAQQLYTSYKWTPSPISQKDARKFIKAKDWLA